MSVRAAERLRARLTPRGVGMLLSGALIGVAAVVIRVSELYAVAAAALLAPLVGLIRVEILARRADWRASVSVVPRRPEVGRPLSIRVALQNYSLLSPAIEVAVDAPFSTTGVRRLVTGMPKGASTELAFDGTASRRGRFAAGPVRLAIVDGFGLARAAWETGEGRDILVLPAFSPVRSMPTLSADEGSSGGGRRSPQRGTEFHALKKYQRGDDLRQVHWRASARHDTLLVRELEPLAMPRLTVLFDDRASAHPDDASLEWAISAAASAVSGAGARGFGVRLITSNARIEPARYGRTATGQLIERLALVQRTGARTLEAAAAAAATTGHGGALLVILGPRCEQASIDAIAALRRRQGWGGALLVGAHGRDASIDGATLIGAGWNVVGVRPHLDRIEAAWKTMLERPSGHGSPSLRS